MNKMYLRAWMALILLASSLAWSPAGFAATQSEAVAVTLYAGPGAAGECASWEDVCDLQTALGKASSGDQIWVAEGTYYPGDVITATFQLVGGVSLYGGFDGTEDALEERDWLEHPTILSGDIDQDGVLDGENVYHVVTSLAITPTAFLDGFTITGGNANVKWASYAGGGLYNTLSSLTLTNVTFSGNSANAGGGMFNKGSSPTMNNVTFSGNSARRGGGMCNDEDSLPKLTNVIFTGNSAEEGGGMYNTDKSGPILFNVTFTGNSADLGGGLYNSYYSSPTLTNVTFSINSASGYGGGMYNYEHSSPTLTNSILWGNTAISDTLSSQIFGPAIVTYSDIGLESGEIYTGTGNINADPRFVHAAGGDLRLKLSSPAIDAGNNEPVTTLTDLDGHLRKIDIPAVQDTGWGEPPLVDMGAYEFFLVYDAFLPIVVK